MAFEKLTPKTRAATDQRKRALVTLTNGKKAVFNVHAVRSIGDLPEGTKADVLFDAETQKIGFRFSKSGAFDVRHGERTLLLKGLDASALPVARQSDKWQMEIAWDKEVQAFVADLAAAVKVPKRGEAVPKRRATDK